MLVRNEVVDVMLNRQYFNLTCLVGCHGYMDICYSTDLHNLRINGKYHRIPQEPNNKRFTKLLSTKIYIHAYIECKYKL